MRQKTILLFLTVLLIMVSGFYLNGAPAKYAIVVNNANSLDSIDGLTIEQIFRGETLTWKNGNSIEIAAMKSGELHKQFLKDNLKMTPLKFAAYWKRKIFTGEGAGSHIKFFKSPQEMKKYITDNPEAIGYIPKSLVDSSIKELSVK